jgi:hypothetical protein
MSGGGGNTYTIAFSVASSCVAICSFSPETSSTCPTIGSCVTIVVIVRIFRHLGVS